MRPTLLFVAGLVLLTGVAGTPSSPPSAEAGTAVDLDVQELVDGAELVFEGRVVDGRSFEDERGVIFTEYDVHVERTFLAEDGTETVQQQVVLQQVVLPGGTLEDGRGMLLAGMPRLDVGERSILFLSAASGASQMRMPIGLSQGRIEVLDAPGGGHLAVRSHSQLTLADPVTGKVVDSEAVDVLDYAGLVAEIRAAVAVRKQHRSHTR